LCRNLSGLTQPMRLYNREVLHQPPQFGRLGFSPVVWELARKLQKFLALPLVNQPNGHVLSLVNTVRSYPWRIPWESGAYGGLILAIQECLTCGDFSLTPSPRSYFTRCSPYQLVEILTRSTRRRITGPYSSVMGEKSPDQLLPNLTDGEPY
jgi:hypothetical protein